MSLSNVRKHAVALCLVAGVALSGCTISPVHGDRSQSGTSQVQLGYATPSSRLEQVFYQTLAARLGSSSSALTPVVSANVSASSSRVGLSTRGEPATDHQVITTVSYRIENAGVLLSSGTRTATSVYRVTGQIVSDDTARQAAEEEAVRAAAQSVVAAILSDPALR